MKQLSIDECYLLENLYHQEYFSTNPESFKEFKQRKRKNNKSIFYHVKHLKSNKFSPKKNKFFEEYEEYYIYNDQEFLNYLSQNKQFVGKYLSLESSSNSFTLNRGLEDTKCLIHNKNSIIVKRNVSFYEDKNSMNVNNYSSTYIGCFFN